MGGDGGGAWAGLDAYVSAGALAQNASFDAGGGLYAGRSLWMTDTDMTANTAMSPGGGAYVGDTATLLVGRFQSNTTNSRGGGIWSHTLRISGTRFLSNTALLNSGGGAFTWYAALNGGDFSGNYAGGAGGGLQVGDVSFIINSTLDLTATQFINNTAAAGNGGGALLTCNSSAICAASMTDATFEHNIASAGGGGLYVEQIASLPIVNTHFISNTAQNGKGGGAWANYSNATLTGSAFEGNAAKQDGGGIYVMYALTATDTVFSNNASQANGGGAYNNTGRAALTRGSFGGNRAGLGGGLFAYGPSLSMTGTQFFSNTALSNGGGVFLNFYGALTNTVFSANNASQDGGGIASAIGPLNIWQTRFVANRAARGGGAAPGSGSATWIINSLFDRNIATTTLGSALFITRPYPIKLTHLTIASPTQGAGSAVYVYNALSGKNAQITDSILSNYRVGVESWGPGQTLENYNLFNATITRTTGVVTGANSLAGDPLFADAAEGNYHLQAGSPAIDHGLDLGIAADLDGYPRSAPPDIGAYEFRALAPRAWLPAVLR